MGTFIKRDPQPFQIPNDLVISTGHVTGRIRIFHPQKKKAALPPDILLCQKGSAQVTQMQATSGAWGISAHRLIALYGAQEISL